MQHIKFLMITCLFLFSFHLFAQSENPDNSVSIEGFWKTINENTKKPESIVAIYKYKGEYFGRIILTYFEDGTIQDTIYNPKKKALGVVGHPSYVGLDIIWGLKPVKGNKYKDGNILDPEKGDIYGAEAWRKASDLIVRGKLFIFGRNQTWPRAVQTDFPEGFQIPDYTSFVPTIPQTI